MCGEISGMININIRRYDGDVLSGNARREVVAREQMRCIDECYPVVITVPQGGTSLHHGLAVLLCKLHSEQSPLIEVDRRRLDDSKTSKGAALICPCHIEELCVVSLRIIEPRERYGMAISVNSERICRKICIFERVLFVVVAAEDIKWSPALVVMRGHSKDPVLEVVVCSGALLSLIHI